MGLRDKLSDDLKEAMRQRDERRKLTIRSVIAAIKNAETQLDADGARISLTDDDIRVLIGRQIKQRQESILAYRSGKREDLATEEEAELSILHEYLPRQWTRDEIVAKARDIIAEVGASGPADIGRVMKPLMTVGRGQLDGRLANEVVRELLAR